MPSSTSSEDYEHWPTRQDSPISTTAALCYDNSNGLRSHVYHPANELKAAPSEPLKAPQPIAPIQPQRVQYLSEQPQLAYGYPPQMTYAAPAYYGYPHPQPIAYPAPAYYSHPTTPYTFGAAYDHIYQPPAAAQQPVAEKPKSLTKTWQGRTKAEVSSDNMLIAAREGAYDARQIEPKNLAADQMVWCVEVDGSQTLRTFAAVKALKGEWRTDPRFRDSWFFVRDGVDEGEGKGDEGEAKAKRRKRGD